MTTKIIHVTDPVTGEIETVDLARRVRIRDTFLNEAGQEIPDPRPLAPPVGYIRQPSMFELVRDQVSRQLALNAGDREFESFEDNEDFDIPDDPADPTSPWENDFDPPWSEVSAAIAADREKRAADAANSITPASATSPPAPKPTDPPVAGGGLAKQDIP